MARRGPCWNSIQRPGHGPEVQHDLPLSPCRLHPLCSLPNPFTSAACPSAQHVSTSGPLHWKFTLLDSSSPSLLSPQPHFSPGRAQRLLPLGLSLTTCGSNRHHLRLCPALPAPSFPTLRSSPFSLYPTYHVCVVWLFFYLVISYF